MLVYRISKKQHADLSGIGGKFTPGRWNFKGTLIVYTASSKSLAILEKLAHVRDFDLLPADLVILTIQIETLALHEVRQEELTKGWRTEERITRILGKSFFDNKKSLLYKVPSAIVPSEANYLIDPEHPEIVNCKIIEMEDFEFDKRLFKG